MNLSVDDHSSPLKKVCIVIPCLNESPNLETLYNRLVSTFSTQEGRYDFRVVFADDGSTDDSWAMVESFAQRDDRFMGVKLLRRFGSHSAIRAGLAAVRADCYIGISADLQDPPEIIPELVAKAEEGFEVVWGERAKRKDPWLKSKLAKLFWNITARFAGPDYPKGGADVFLFRKNVVDRLLSFREKNTMFYLQVGWAGFKATSIPYERGARLAGESKWSYSRRITAAVGAIASFSDVPLRFISLAGGVVALSGLLLGAFLVVDYFFGNPSPGWTSIVVLMLVLFGVNMIMLGVVAEYLWRIFDQVKSRPDYLVDKTAGPVDERPVCRWSE